MRTAWVYIVTTIIMSGVLGAAIMGAVAMAGEKEPYTKEQTYTETYSGTPADIEIVPGSNIDILNAGGGDWTYQVRLIDGDGAIIEITEPGEKPKAQMEVTATLSNVKAGLSACGVADPAAFLVTLRRALLKVAKAKLPQ